MQEPKSSGLTDRTRETLRAVLQYVLAEESHLAAATHDYVWRVRGSPLQSLKRLFVEQGRQIDRWVSDIGEQARTLGVAFSTDRGEPATDSHAILTEEAPRASTRVLINELLTMHERLAAHLRGDIGILERRVDEDPKAERLLSSLLEFHETTAWMLRLLLESPEPLREP